MTTTTRRRHPRATTSSIWLQGCVSHDEHQFKKSLLIQMLRHFKGEEGLERSGLAYKSVPVGGTTEEEGVRVDNSRSNSGDTANDDVDIDIDTVQNIQHGVEGRNSTSIGTATSSSVDGAAAAAAAAAGVEPRTMTRLFHIDSNVMITASNRKQYIADGAHYEIITRLAMEQAQAIMIRDGRLAWTVIDEHAPAVVTMSSRSLLNNYSLSERQQPPIRALLSHRLLEQEARVEDEPTLLIVTGKGRARTGTFTRQHLVTSGLECSGAVPFVRAATERQMNVIILDPNARGDRVGMETFQKSMNHLFRRWNTNDTDNDNNNNNNQDGRNDSTNNNTTNNNNNHNTKPKPKPTPNLYVLCHSQSGSQFVRYLLDKSERYLQRIAAVAFTDSNHNLQWTTQNRPLQVLLESDRCVYFKRSEDDFLHTLHPRSEQNTDEYMLTPLATIGNVIETDQFWHHRFGAIRTLCAGTSEHSLTNWFPRHLIWEHFDRYRQQGAEEKEVEEKETIILEGVHGDNVLV